MTDNGQTDPTKTWSDSRSRNGQIRKALLDHYAALMREARRIRTLIDALDGAPSLARESAPGVAMPGPIGDAAYGVYIVKNNVELQSTE